MHVLGRAAEQLEEPTYFFGGVASCTSTQRVVRPHARAVSLTSVRRLRIESDRAPEIEIQTRLAECRCRQPASRARAFAERMPVERTMRVHSRAY